MNKDQVLKDILEDKPVDAPYLEYLFAKAIGIKTAENPENDWCDYMFDWNFVGPLVEKDNSLLNLAFKLKMIYFAYEKIELTFLEAIKRVIIKKEHG